MIRIRDIVERAGHSLWSSGHASRDLTRHEFDVNPHEAYSRWRKESSVQYFPRNDAIVVLGYESAVSVLKDPATFSSEPFESFSSRLLHASDPPEHTRMRQLLSPFFSPARQSGLRSLVSRVTAEAAKRISAKSSFDVLSDFADQVPLTIACEWLGIEADMARQLLDLPLERATWDSVGPSITSRGLIREIENSGGLQHDDLAQLASFFLRASVLTSRDFIWLALYTLASNSEILKTARGNPNVIGAVTNELFRLEPPVHAVLRSARAEVQLEGCSIREGQTVWISIGAANRDPSKFPFPDSIKLDRTGPRHLSFGSGPHFCLGSHLGKMEAEAALEALLPFVSPKSFARLPALTFGDNDGLPIMRRVSQWNIAVSR